MPRRHTRSHRNQDEEDTDVDFDEAPQRRPRKPRLPSWLKWVGATAAGAVIGGIAMRKYDEYFPPDGKKRNEELEQNPQGMLPASPMGASPFMPIFSFGGGAPPPPQSNPASKKRRKSVAELTQELRQRKQEERAQRYAEAEEAFFDED